MQDRVLKQLLDYARSDAEAGRVPYAQIYLREAQKYADKVKIEIPKETLTEIEETAYRSGVEVELDHARSDTEAGMVPGAQRHLRKAQEYAAKLEINISDRVREIEEKLEK